MLILKNDNKTRAPILIKNLNSKLKIVEKLYNNYL